MKDLIIRYIDRFIFGIILATVFVVPLYFSFFYSFGTGFLINVAIDKTVVFKVLVLVLLFFTFAKICFEKKISFSADKKILIAIFLFLASLVISTIFSIDRNTSIFGTYWRQQGLITNLYYFLFFFLLILNIKDGKQVEKIISALLLSSFIVSLIGVLGWFNIDPLSLRAKNSNRAVSTFGQPVFLGNFLVLTIFLSFYKVKISNHFWCRLLFFLGLVFQFFCLVFTYGRGAWLAFVLGVLILFFFFIYQKKSNFFWPLLIILIIGLSVISVYGVNHYGEDKTIKSLNFKSRIESFFNYKIASSGLRIKYWKAGIDLIKYKPIIGYGLESQRNVFIKYSDSSWLIYEEINSYADRAHNEYFDLILTCGFIGLLTFCGFLFLFFKKIVFYVKSGGINKELVTLLAISLIAYLAGLFFSFSITETNVIFWLYLAFLYLMLNDFKNNFYLDFAQARKIVTIILFSFLIYFVPMISLQIYNEINKIRADYYFFHAIVDFKTKNYKDMLNNYFQTLAFNNNEYYRTAFLFNLVRSNIESFGFDNQQKNDQTTVDLLASIMKEDEKLPIDFFRKMRSALYYVYLGSHEDDKYFDQAEKTYLNIINDYPNLPETYIELGNSYYLRKNHVDAINYYEKALSKLPSLNHPELVAQHKQSLILYSMPIYKNIAYSYLALGNIEQSLEYLHKALTLNIYDMELYRKLSDVYYIKGDIEKAIKYAESGLKLFPLDSSWTYSLAYLYKEKGEFTLAKIFFERAKKMIRPTGYKEDFLIKIEKDL